MASRFLRSLFTSAPCLLGVQLKPLSAFHMAALAAFDSPFAKGGTATSDDLVLALWICKHSFADAARLLCPSDADLEWLRDWGQPFDFDAVMAAFVAYLDTALDFPDVWVPADNSRTSNIDAPFLLVNTVLSEVTGLTEQEAWDMPINRLVAHRCAIAERNGCEVVSERQEKLLELKSAIEKGATHG